jgi:uncharacterized protein
VVGRLAAEPVGASAPPPADEFRLTASPEVFARTFLRLALTLLPEYLLVVFLLGLFRGWVFPLGAGGEHWALLGTLLAAALGTLVVVPTAGEIPILQGLAAIGMGAGTIGALLITLPAISLVSMAMVARALTPRVTLMMAAAVAVCGLVAGGLLAALG